MKLTRSTDRWVCSAVNKGSFALQAAAGFQLYEIENQHATILAIRKLKKSQRLIAQELD
jgi:hypothetical protein